MCNCRTYMRNICVNLRHRIFDRIEHSPHWLNEYWKVSMSKYACNNKPLRCEYIGNWRRAKSTGSYIWNAFPTAVQFWCCQMFECIGAFLSLEHYFPWAFFFLFFSSFNNHLANAELAIVWTVLFFGFSSGNSRKYFKWI